jgi:hypothetical protein
MESSKIADGEVIGAGIDAPKQRRPGVPIETRPQIAKGAHWDSPARQQPHGEILRRPDLAELTPVFGTAQPPHGLSGVIRRYAYTLPDHKSQRWAALLVADRVDVAESGLADLFRRRPLAVAAGFLLLVGAGVAVGAALRGRRSGIGRALG